MLTNQIGVYDVVLLKDGRQGTVVDIYDKPGLPVGYDIELSNTKLELVTVEIDKIQKVIAKAH